MENATKAQGSGILDTTRICSSFPETYGIQIKRENILHSLETTLDSETYILTVEGCEGMGKTRSYFKTLRKVIMKQAI